MENDFGRWTGIKKAPDGADETTRLYFREGEVWWVRLGKNIGYETDGKSREFTRPVIILKKYNQFISGASTHDRAEAQSQPSPDRDRGRQAGVRNALAASQYRQQAPRQKDQPLDGDIHVAIKKEAPNYFIRWFLATDSANFLIKLQAAPFPIRRISGDAPNSGYTSLHID